MAARLIKEEPTRYFMPPNGRHTITYLWCTLAKKYEPKSHQVSISNFQFIRNNRGQRYVRNNISGLQSTKFSEKFYRKKMTSFLHYLNYKRKKKGRKYKLKDLERYINYPLWYMAISWIFLGHEKLKKLCSNWGNLNMTGYLMTLRNRWGFFFFFWYDDVILLCFLRINILEIILDNFG